MNKILHNTPVFRNMSKYDGKKWVSKIEVVCADVYKIKVYNDYRLICAFRNKSRWIPMDVLTGMMLPAIFTTKTTALQALVDYFEEYLNPEDTHISIYRIENLLRAEKELFKALDENQKVCYNKLVDLCEN